MPFLKSFDVLPDQALISNSDIKNRVHQAFQKSAVLSEEEIRKIETSICKQYKKENPNVDKSLLKEEVGEICKNIIDEITKAQNTIKDADKLMENLKQNISKYPENTHSYFNKTIKIIKNKVSGVANSPIANLLLQYYVTSIMSNMFASAMVEATSNQNPLVISEKEVNVWAVKANDVSLYFYLALNNLYSHFTMTRAETMKGTIVAQHTNIYTTDISDIMRKANNSHECASFVAIYANLEKFIKEIKNFKPFNGVAIPDLSEYLQDQNRNFKNHKCQGGIENDVVIDKQTVRSFYDKCDTKNINNPYATTKQNTKAIMHQNNTAAPIPNNNDNDYDYFYEIPTSNHTARSTVAQNNTNSDDDNDVVVHGNKNNSDNDGNPFLKIISGAVGSLVGAAAIGGAATLGAITAIEKCTKKSIYDMLFCKKKERNIDNLEEGTEMLPMSKKDSELARRNDKDGQRIVRL
jgi:hypothetical protein